MPKIIIFATKSIKMKQKLLVGILFLVLLFCSFFACLPLFFEGKQTCYKSPNPQNERALIWKIEGNGLEKPSYIMGTMHTQCPEIVKHIEGWEEASTQCEMVVSESTLQESLWYIDSVGRKTVDLMNTVFRDSNLWKRFYADPVQYKNVYTDFQIEAIRAYDSILLRLQPISEIPRIKQLIASNAKKEQLYPRLHHFTPEPVQSMDFGLLRKFQEERALPNVGLDDSVCSNYGSNVDQYDIELTEFEKKPLDDQAKMVYALIKQKDLILDRMKAIDSIYYFHDPYCLETALKHWATSYPDYDANKYNLEDSLTYATRNEKWMKKIPQYMEEKSCLIMVGFGHLVKTQNDRGLIQRLREMNYTLTPYLYKDGND